MRDFLRVAFLRNFRQAVRDVLIDGRCRHGGVERDVIVLAASAFR